MSAVSHLDMFYDTRNSVHIDNTNPANNPNTELNNTPDEAVIRYEDGTEQHVDAAEWSGRCEKGFEIARFLVGRAMLDPDARVIPL
jgi:hypothetical protein